MIVAGQEITELEFDYLDELAGYDCTTADLSVSVNPADREIRTRRSLRRLEGLGLVREVRRDLWALTDAGAEPFGGLV